jgi:hypothetical protein
MTKWAVPSSTTFSPSTLSAPPNRACQRAWLSTTVEAAPGAPSSGPKSRPSDGRTPSMCNTSGVTHWPSRRSGSPTPPRLQAIEPNAPTSSKDRLMAFQSR